MLKASFQMCWLGSSDSKPCTMLKGRHVCKQASVLARLQNLHWTWPRHRTRCQCWSRRQHDCGWRWCFLQPFLGASEIRGWRIDEVLEDRISETAKGTCQNASWDSTSPQGLNMTWDANCTFFRWWLKEMREMRMMQGVQKLNFGKRVNKLNMTMTLQSYQSKVPLSIPIKCPWNWNHQHVWYHVRAIYKVPTTPLAK